MTVDSVEATALVLLVPGGRQVSLAGVKTWMTPAAMVAPYRAAADRYEREFRLLAS